MGTQGNEYSQTIENILNAMAEITNAQARQLSFDKTIKAIIVDAGQSSHGIYQVSQIGAEKTNVFIAHSNVTTYQKGDCVYITIPEGDMASGNKIILGKYVNSDEAYYNYVNPLEGFLDITGNLIESLDANQWELTANYEDLSEIIIWSAQNLNLRGYDRLALKGQFKTWLQSSDINSGTYGLVLIVEDGSGKFTTFQLTTQEMYGNPYYFETFYSQNILVNIGDIEEIKSLHLAFVQRNDFYTSEGYEASGEGENGTRAPGNIFLKAPYISVGYDISTFAGDDVRIFTSDEQTFSSEEPSTQKTITANWIHVPDGKSAIVVDDIVKMPLNPNYDATTSGEELFPTPVTKADLVWFEYDINFSGSHFAAGQGWVEDTENVNNFTYTINTPSGSETDDEAHSIPYIKYKAMVMTPSLRYVNSSFVETDNYKAIDECKDEAHMEIYLECKAIFHEIMTGEKTYNDGKTLIQEKYKDITSDDYANFITALNAYLNLRSEIKWIDSGELIFPNTDYAPGKYAEGAIANLRINTDPEHLKGVYLVYDDTGNIINPTDASQLRYCEALYDTIAGVINQEGTTAEDIAYNIDSTEAITWYIPIEGTMIATPTSGIEYYAGDEVKPNYVITAASATENIPKGKYCKITRVPQFDETTVDSELLIAEHHMFARQNFRIKDYYTQSETNNQIYCRISKGGKNWYATAALEFGVSGTNGTDSTFVLKMYEVNADDSQSTVETSALSLSTTYYEVDKDNNTVSLTEPKPGKVILVPKLYDYNKQELEDYFTSTNLTYKLYPEVQQGETSPFVIERRTDNTLLVRFNTAESSGYKIDKFSENLDYYLVVEAEVAYKITYEFMVYTDTKDANDPTYLSDAAKALGKQIGDYVLDDYGNKQPKLNGQGQPVTRDDRLKTYLPISIIKNKIQKKKVVPPDPSTGEANTTPGAGATPPDTSSYLKQIVGANRVIYDRNGSNAKYYKDPYQLFNEDLEEITGISWGTSIKAVKTAAEIDKTTIASFYPQVLTTTDPTDETKVSNTLLPLEMYMLGGTVPPNFCVVGKKDSDIVCIQPVLIMQNKYGSSMLNKWDGSLTIDEKNGTILASMVGAGIKEDNNTFSGVLMGEVSQAFKDNHNGLGLYGFHQNDQSFGFNVNGTAFIGKAGHGRIWFNGNNGTIRSGAYSDGISNEFTDYYETTDDGTFTVRPQQGMEIDLDGTDGASASLKMFSPVGGFVVDTKQITMDDYWSRTANSVPTGQSSMVFKLFTGKYGESERGMIYFDDDGQYIQSTNYNGSYGTRDQFKQKLNSVLGINLSNDAKFDSAPKGLNGQIIPPGWTYPVTENGVTTYTTNGDTAATAGAFIDLQNGWIDMRNGIVGGWKISQDKISTMNDEIVLWGGNPTSNTEDGSPYVRIGAVRGTTMYGKLWIADYRVLGSTISATDDDSLTVSTIAWSNITLDASGYNNFDDSEGASLGSVDSLSNLYTASLNENKFSSSAVNSWALKDDTTRNAAIGLGVVLETATSDTASDGSIILWRPSWENGKKVSASLGTMDRPWSTAFIDGGLFMNESFTKFDGKNSSGWHLVATQDWVSQVIVAALNCRIKDVNNLASSALSKANKALGKANNAISDILSWCSTFNNRQFVTDFVVVKRDDGTYLSYNLTTVTANADPKTGALTGTVEMAVEKTDAPFTGYKITMGTQHTGSTLYGTSDTVSWSDISSVAHAINETRNGLYHHAHLATMSADSGAISCTTSPADKTGTASACTIFTSTGVDVSESNGTVTVKVTVAGQDASDSFNMASTKFYKDAVEAARKKGYNEGKEDATCTKKHAGDTKKEGGVTYKLEWVAQ